MTAAILIRPYEVSDLPNVLDVLRDSLGETEVSRRTAELFSWKHIDNPFGRSIMLVAEDGDGVVGFRAFMRWELMTPKGRLLRCVRPVDTATHPRARRQGIFRRLTEAAVDIAQSEGVDLIFNTPNAHSRAGYIGMGWQEVGAIGAMVRPLRRMFRRATVFPTFSGGTDWGIRETDDRTPLGLRTPRRADYLEWRFDRHPTARYIVLEAPEGSWAVLRSNIRNRRGELVVSDLFGESAARALRRAGRHTDAGYLVGWAPRGTPERRQLTRAGLLPVPGVRALTLVARPLTSAALDATSLSNWDIGLSDLELL